ncbi:hypothetical protein LCGC14_1940940 [marine sediment metagenome]|uniref:HNH endonuclease n=1 Tax=marine sediment metagenome TaxID=412755 RepID=A0A0F9FKB7_9ZZZZ
MIKCKQCNKEFIPPKSISRFCSIPCYHLSQKENPNKGTFQKGHYLKHNNHKKGLECHFWKGGQITLVCKICKNDFQVDPYRSKIAKTCSKVCYDEMRKTPEFRLNHSDIQRKIIEERLGEIRSHITALDKLIRNSSMYKIWREYVFERDDYTCQMCKKRGGTLRADHIKQFASILIENDVKTFEDALNCVTLWDVRNGRTLCEQCHYKTPTYGRKVNSNQIYEPKKT